MRKKYFFGVGVLILCVAAWGIYKVFESHTNVGGVEAVARLSSLNFYNEFQNSENLANKKWVGKVIEVTGPISSINESGNYISITLGATADGGINCSILKKDLNKDDKFNKGDTITIKGKCTGFLMDVNLVDCVVKK
jgi:hypothetical protein